MQENRDIKILRTTPVKGWRAVYAALREDGGTELEEERVSAFALCEDEQGQRFVSGVDEDGKLCVMRDDFVGHFSIKDRRHKIQEAVGRFARAREQ